MARTDVSAARRRWMVRLAGAGLCCLWALSSQGCQDNIPTDIEVDDLDPQPDANAEQNPDPNPEPQPDPNPQVDPIECESNVNCEDDELCVLEAGLCGGTGVCEARPQGCPEIFSPVCGCDGETYGNDCEAKADGVNVRHVGECDEPPNGCNSNDDCGDAQYCAFEDGLCGGEGACETRPEACTDEADPVCGCDDTTYGNACQAAQEGVSVAREGRCDGPPDTCETSEDCGRGRFCECSGDACGEGVCAVAPQECPDVFDPVCGCDGRIYPNDCDRRNAGVCLAPEERCEEPLERCLNNEDCSDNAFCEFEPGTCGEEGTGVCAERPEGCFDVVDPVCGCDGETYTNDCQRQLAGVSQVHEGECEAPPNSCESNRECGDGEFCECRGNACGLGLCEDRPRNCTEEFAPVCGCDNVTYGNDCARQAEGVCFLHRGECEQGPIRCEGNGDCGDREYCQFEADTCGGVGLCEIRPDVCPDVEAPVCGCDGQTYGNRCVAAASGVSVEREGACDDTPQRCRGNEGCDRGDFCECSGDACGDGVCAERPNACPDIFAPVCGCDNTTYSNDCERRAAGACLLHRGECEAPPEGCRNQNDCGDVEVCIFNDGDCFNRERIGACEERPEFCNRLLDPVCGCDGATYGNRCEATRAGVSVAFEGECEDPPQLCEDSDDCDRGDFCECRGEACGDGVCEPRPELCTRELAPVCGCDNETYTNDCLRRAAGTCLLHRGACDEPVDDCRNNEDCGDGNFCEHEPGTCFNRERIGACEERPELCTRELAPVCGCDGETYTNDCQRRAAGVALDHRGECGDPAEDCRENEDCGRDEFCAKDAGACRDEEPTIGACEPRPERCPLVLDPVCGCDGTTYGNACEAAQEGINILHDGVCDDPNDVCISDRECESNAYCAFEDSVCGGEGICEDRPRACPDIFAPVCGCDGQTYGNACEAASEGVSIEAEGECPEPGGDCRNNGDCFERQYCSMEPGLCLEENAVGVCSERPGICPLVVDPVCGCDGRTYNNSCDANSRGINVASEGPCEEEPRVCGGIQGLTCNRGEFCDPDIDSCRVPDATGVCTVVEELCEPISAPVCGCDGRSYRNDCLRIQAGVGKQAEGECRNR